MPVQKFKVLSSKKQRKAEKTIRVLFPQPSYEAMLASFAVADAASGEGYAIAQCGVKVDSTKKHWTYLVRSIHLPSRDSLFERSSITVTPRADFMEPILTEASEKNNLILELHTHVGSKEPNFSWVDIQNGLENGRFLRSCGLRFAMAVVGIEGLSLCEYDAEHDSLQTPEQAYFSAIMRTGTKSLLAHKHVPGIDPVAGMNGIESARVAIVGLGGIGFGIASMLARMGVKRFLLLDDGVVDAASPDLSPFVSTADSGKKRTRVAQGTLKKISKDIEVTQLGGPAGDAKQEMKECDVVFGCSGDREACSVINDVSLKYFIPYIDARLVKGPKMSGRVRVVVPSITACPGCAGEEPCETASDDPAVVTINNVIASIAVQEFADMASGKDIGAKPFDYIEYDPERQSIERKAAERNASCALCGNGGVLGAGDDRKSMKKSAKTK